MINNIMRQICEKNKNSVVPLSTFRSKINHCFESHWQGVYAAVMQTSKSLATFAGQGAAVRYKDGEETG